MPVKKREVKEHRSVQIPVMVTPSEAKLIEREVSIAKRDRVGWTRSTFCAELILRACKRD